MLHRTLPLLLAAALGAHATSQTLSVNDVGLTMDGGLLAVLYGQICGPVSCTQMPAGTISGGTVRTLIHYGAPTSPGVIAIGLQGPCIPLPGLANALLLGSPLTLVLNVTSGASPNAACRQGAFRYPLNVPPNAPTGLVVRFQSVGVSNSGQIAFGPALETTVQ